MATLNDIAIAAGVNVSTVSRVLNRTGGISEETVRSVLRVAEEVGYKPKRKRAQTKAIGIIINELASQYYGKLLHMLEKRIREKNYGMLLTLTDFRFSKLLDAFSIMGNNGVEGIICSQIVDMSPAMRDEIYLAAEKTGVPVVFLSDGYDEGDPRFDQINLNQRRGMEQIVNHLMSLGHERIGFVGEVLSISRVQILESLMEAHHMTITPDHIKVGETRFEQGGYEQMKLLLLEPERPTAVIAGYDQVAVGALKAIWEAGLRVPEDISLVGFDNIVLDEYLPRKLTSVTNPVDSMAQIATKLLFGRIEDSTAVTQTVSLHPTLIVRETTMALSQQKSG